MEQFLQAANGQQAGAAQQQVLQVGAGAGQQALTIGGQQIVLPTVGGQTLQLGGQQLVVQQPQQQPQFQLVQTVDGQIVFQPVQQQPAQPEPAQQPVIQIQTANGGVIQLPLSALGGLAGQQVLAGAQVQAPANAATNTIVTVPQAGQQQGQMLMMMNQQAAAPTPTPAAAPVPAATNLQQPRVPISGEGQPAAEVLEEEPLYVNAKQYHRILKRRQARARLEAEGKIPKERKKYLHESRHRHAMSRVRGDGGRFYSKDELEARRKLAAGESLSHSPITVPVTTQNGAGTPTPAQLIAPHVSQVFG